MIKKRAIRRKHNQRLINNRKYYWGRELDKQNLGRVVDTPCSCSCMLCGNPRKHFNQKTIQELKNEITYKEEVNDCYRET